MNTMLPAPRDLPPARHARIRAEVERQTTQPVPRERRWVIPVAVTAGLTVLAAAVWVVPRQLAGEDQPAAPPPGVPVIAGVSDGERAAIEDGCGRAAIGDGSAPKRPGAPESPGSFRLYNLVTDNAGRMALLYDQTAALFCLFDSSGIPRASAYGLANTGTPDGPITVDLYLISQAGEVTSTHPVLPDMVVIGGRAGPEVARVTVTQNDRDMQATLANGSFFVRLLRPFPWINQGAHGPVIRAYDKDNKLLMTVGG